MGLGTAFYLSKAGVDVTVLEKCKEIGGLCRSEEIVPGLRWDRYYHVILSTDSELLEFIDEIGLSLDVQVRETGTGFYTDGQLHSMSSTLEFLKFKPLSLWDKLRLSGGILYASKITDWKRLEKLYVKTWLTRVFGRRNYEKMWDPLLRCKLGTAKEKASAAFIWAIIKRLYGTRQTSSKRELVGCVKDGYYSILSRVRDHLEKNGASVLVDHRIDSVEPLSNGTVRIRCNGGKPLEFDRVVATIPNPGIARICPGLPHDFRLQLKSVRYLNLICLTLVLNRSLSPFYVTNITDSGLPFTGIIEATHVIPRGMLGTKALVYLPRWIPPDDSFYQTPDEDVLEMFLRALQSIIPHFSNEDIIAHRVNREPYVQPIMEVGYSEKVPPMQTPLKNFYIVNTSMILNSTLNNNQVIHLSRKMANLLLNQ